jgi:ubiquitin carboxyl-terminal hydrolase 22/27/51
MAQTASESVNTPRLTRPVYCTCEHLKKEDVRAACSISLNAALRVDSCNEFACTRCSRLGSLTDIDFINHFDAMKHNVAVRVVANELYCVTCRDYQYHSEFDRRLGKRRRATESSSERLVLPSRSPGLLRGVVNMGNTCFLSSVLQVLLHSEILTRYFTAERTKYAVPHIDSKSCIACGAQKMFDDLLTKRR